MKVLVIGGSGLVAGMAADALEDAGCQGLRASGSSELADACHEAFGSTP